MKHHTRRIISLVALAALLSLTIGAIATRPVAASASLSEPRLQDDDEEEIEITGTARHFNVDAGTFTVSDGSETYTVVVTEDFDLTTLEDGDLVEVEGVAGEEANTIVAIKVKEEFEDDDVEDEDDDEDGVSFFCANREFTHPVAVRLANAYGVGEDWVMTWFCDNEMGMGQIMLALRTAAGTGEAPETYLEMRSERIGWGRIWKERGLIGRGRMIDRDGDEGADRRGGPPPWAGGQGREGRGRESAPGQLKKRGNGAQPGGD